MDKTSFNNLARHPLQSWEWGEARQAMGIEVKRFFNKENVFQLTIHPIPYTPYKIGYLPRSVFPDNEMLNEMYVFAKSKNLIFIKLEPNVNKDDSKKFTLDSRLQPSPHPLFPQWTQVLDLTPSEDQLLKSMKPKTRYNVNLALKKGVTIKEESNDHGFNLFSKLYFETCRRQHYFGHTESYHQTIWNHLKNGIAHLMIAYYNETPLAAYELFHFKDMLYYPYGGTSNEFRNLMASNLLMWESIRLGKKLGARAFDMWGSLPPHYSQNHSWAGFTRFKEGYGTTFIEKIGSFDLIVHPNLYALYNATHKLREKYLSLK